MLGISWLKSAISMEVFVHALRETDRMRFSKAVGGE